MPKGTGELKVHTVGWFELCTPSWKSRRAAIHSSLTGSGRTSGTAQSAWGLLTVFAEYFFLLFVVLLKSFWYDSQPVREVRAVTPCPSAFTSKLPGPPLGSPCETNVSFPGISTHTFLILLIAEQPRDHGTALLLLAAILPLLDWSINPIPGFPTVQKLRAASLPEMPYLHKLNYKQYATSFSFVLLNWFACASERSAD